MEGTPSQVIKVNEEIILERLIDALERIAEQLEILNEMSLRQASKTPSQKDGS